MKIGIDCRIYSEKFTGIGRYTKELVDHLIKINEAEGYPHEFTLFFNGPEHKDFDPPKNVKKVLVNAPHYSFVEQWKFFWKIRRENLDTMHFPHFNLPILYRRPFTVTIHDLTLTLFPMPVAGFKKVIKFFQQIAYKVIIKNAVHKARKVIAVSHNTANDLKELLHTPASKIHVIHNGVNPEYTLITKPEKDHPTLKKYNITKEFILYTGVWRHHKNLPRLIKAFSKLRTKGLDIQLVLTGNNSDRFKEIRQTIEEENVSQDVITPGFVSEKELLHLYNAALIYAFPSLYEGFGLPPLEAMKCGTPVVASNVSSIPEVCADAALYFDPYDTDDIADKISTLYHDADLRTDMAEKGMRRANKFTWDAMAVETYKLITQK